MGDDAEEGSVRKRLQLFGATTSSSSTSKPGSTTSVFARATPTATPNTAAPAAKGSTGAITIPSSSLPSTTAAPVPTATPQKPGPAQPTVVSTPSVPIAAATTNPPVTPQVASQVGSLKKNASIFGTPISKPPTIESSVELVTPIKTHLKPTGALATGAKSASAVSIPTTTTAVTTPSQSFVSSGPFGSLRKVTQPSTQDNKSSSQPVAPTSATLEPQLVQSVQPVQPSTSNTVTTDSDVKPAQFSRLSSSTPALLPSSTTAVSTAHATPAAAVTSIFGPRVGTLGKNHVKDKEKPQESTTTGPALIITGGASPSHSRSLSKQSSDAETLERRSSTDTLEQPPEIARTSSPTLLRSVPTEVPLSASTVQAQSINSESSTLKKTSIFGPMKTTNTFVNTAAVGNITNAPTVKEASTTKAPILPSQGATPSVVSPTSSPLNPWHTNVPSAETASEPFEMIRKISPFGPTIGATKIDTSGSAPKSLGGVAASKAVFQNAQTSSPSAPAGFGSKLLSSQSLQASPVQTPPTQSPVSLTPQSRTSPKIVVEPEFVLDGIDVPSVPLATGSSNLFARSTSAQPANAKISLGVAELDTGVLIRSKSTENDLNIVPPFTSNTIKLLDTSPSSSPYGFGETSTSTTSSATNLHQLGASSTSVNSAGSVGSLPSSSPSDGLYLTVLAQSTQKLPTVGSREPVTAPSQTPVVGPSKFPVKHTASPLPTSSHTVGRHTEPAQPEAGPALKSASLHFGVKLTSSAQPSNPRAPTAQDTPSVTAQAKNHNNHNNNSSNSNNTSNNSTNAKSSQETGSLNSAQGRASTPPVENSGSPSRSRNSSFKSSLNPFRRPSLTKAGRYTISSKVTHELIKEQANVTAVGHTNSSSKVAITSVTAAQPPQGVDQDSVASTLPLDTKARAPESPQVRARSKPLVFVNPSTPASASTTKPATTSATTASITTASTMASQPTVASGTTVSASAEEKPVGKLSVASVFGGTLKSTPKSVQQATPSVTAPVTAIPGSSNLPVVAESPSVSSPLPALRRPSREIDAASAVTAAASRVQGMNRARPRSMFEPTSDMLRQADLEVDPVVDQQQRSATLKLGVRFASEPDPSSHIPRQHSLLGLIEGHDRVRLKSESKVKRRLPTRRRSVIGRLGRNEDELADD